MLYLQWSQASQFAPDGFTDGFFRPPLCAEGATGRVASGGGRAVDEPEEGTGEGLRPDPVKSTNEGAGDGGKLVISRNLTCTANSECVSAKALPFCWFS